MGQPTDRTSPETPFARVPRAIRLADLSGPDVDAAFARQGGKCSCGNEIDRQLSFAIRAPAGNRELSLICSACGAMLPMA